MQCHWHECGHVVFGNEKQYRINLVLDTPMYSGYTAFNKFIAKYMAQSFGIYNPNMYLQFALFIPQYLPRCSQRKSPDRDCKLVYGYNSEAQNCIFDAQIYSFLFRHFEKSFRKSRKSPENSAFCVVSCKTVISDKW